MCDVRLCVGVDGPGSAGDVGEDGMDMDAAGDGGCS